MIKTLSKIKMAGDFTPAEGQEFQLTIPIKLRTDRFYKLELNDGSIIEGKVIKANFTDRKHGIVSSAFVIQSNTGGKVEDNIIYHKDIKNVLKRK